MASKKESDIQNFWQENPCGENLTGKLEEWSSHFAHYDAFRYSTEGHILDELDTVDFNGKEVLEVGVGQAADSFQIAKRGANWNGLDLTAAAVERAKARFAISNTSFGKVLQGSATNMPWPDNSFDIVYSHGVLHHIPEVRLVSKEIHRVLKPGGLLVIMMYHKNSLNYYLSIAVIRRLGLLVIYSLDKLGLYEPPKDSVFAGHVKNARVFGLWSYLKLNKFTHHNTDGPDNPYALVYDESKIAEDFSEFDIKRTAVHFLNARHFPGANFLPKFIYTYLDRKFGWHLWAYLKPKA